MATLSELHIHPVKSLRGIALDRSEATPHGLAHDRRFMLVKANGVFQTQRDIGELALIHTALEPDGVRLSREGHGDILLPFDDSGGATLSTRVWGDECRVTDLGDPVAEWLTRAAGSRHPLRLVRMADGYRRPQNHPEILGQATETLFADAAPFLVASRASLDRLNRELSARHLAPVPMNRFRPNLVIDGLPPFMEHSVATLTGPGYRLRLRAPCERCVVTTIDQETGVRHPDREPFRTLRDINPMPGNPKAPAFAQYATLDACEPGAQPAVGDALEVALEPAPAG